MSAMLDQVREQYAAGVIDVDELERRVARILVSDVDDAPVIESAAPAHVCRSCYRLTDETYARGLCRVCWEGRDPVSFLPPPSEGS